MLRLGAHNLYEYVAGDPVNAYDHTGFGLFSNATRHNEVTPDGQENIERMDCDIARISNGAKDQAIDAGVTLVPVPGGSGLKWWIKMAIDWVIKKFAKDEGKKQCNRKKPTPSNS